MVVGIQSLFRNFRDNFTSCRWSKPRNTSSFPSAQQYLSWDLAGSYFFIVTFFPSTFLIFIQNKSSYFFLQLLSNISHLRNFLIINKKVKKNWNKKILAASEAVKMATNGAEVANTQAVPQKPKGMMQRPKKILQRLKRVLLRPKRQS